MEIEADIVLLLECMKCETDNPAALKQALVTIATICLNQGSQEFLRTSGGLQHIAQLLLNTKHLEVKQAAMYTLGCAVNQNIYCQKELCTTPGMFGLLYEVLSSGHTSVQLMQTSVFLLLCLAANNSMGQTLVNRSKCLNVLLDLFRITLRSSGPHQGRPAWFDQVGGASSTDLWCSVASALSACVNNPQNDENQRVCTEVFPQAFKFLQEHHEAEIIKPAVSFIGLTAANNVHNQDRVLKCGGLEVLANCLYRATNHVHQGAGPDSLAVCTAVTSTIDTIITDNVQTARRCGELGVIGVLLRLLQSSSLGPGDRLQVTVTLGHCTDASEANQVELVEQGGMAILLQQLTDVGDEELTKATKYVLQSCIHARNNKSLLCQPPQSQVVERNIPTADNIPDYLLRQRHDVEDDMQQKMERLERSLEDAEHMSRMIAMETTLAPPTVPAVCRAAPPRRQPGVWRGPRTPESVHHPRAPPASQRETVRSESDGGKRTAESALRKEAETDKLKAELRKERALRKKLETEAAAARKALEEKQKQEAAAADRAAALVREFNRQEDEEGDSDRLLRQQVEESKKEHERLLNMKEQKQKELILIQKQLSNLKNTSGVGQEESAASQAGSHGNRPPSPSNQDAPTPKSVRMTPKKSERSPTSSVTLGVRNTGSGTEQLQVKPSPRKMATVGVQTLGESQSDSDTPTSKANASRPGATGPQQNSVSSKKLDSVSSKKLDSDGFLVPQTPVATKRNPNRIVPSSVPARPTHLASNIHRYIRKKDTPRWEKDTPRREMNTPRREVNTPRREVNTPRREVNTPRREVNTPRREVNTPRREMNTQELPRVNAFVPPSPTPSLQSIFDQELIRIVQPGTPSLHRQRTPVTPQYSVKRLRGATSATSRRLFSWNRLPKTADPGDKPVRSSGKPPFSVYEDEFEDDMNEDCHTRSPGSTISVVSAGSSMVAGTRSMCPGCQPPSTTGGPLLNSRTYNIVMETSSGTCPTHRHLRDRERQGIAARRKAAKLRNKGRPLRDIKNISKEVDAARRVKKLMADPADIYNFESSSSADDGYVSPADDVASTDSVRLGKMGVVLSQDRRPRVPYSDREVAILERGVQIHGRSWNQVLASASGCFHPSRTAVDLKDKYRRMRLQQRLAEEDTIDTERKPPRHFSMVEERRLRRGVRSLGYSWKSILATYRFARGRTAVELRNKWKSMHRMGRQR